MPEKWFLNSRGSGLVASPSWMASPWWPSDSLQTKQRGLLRLLALSHRQGSDPRSMIHNLAMENRGRYRRILNRLVARLESGTSVIDALEQVPDAIDDNDLLALQVGAEYDLSSLKSGTETDSIGEAFTELLKSGESQNGGNQTIKRNLNVYFVLLAIVFLLMTNFIATFIAPILRQIHEEFDITGNGISQDLMTILVDGFGASMPYASILFFALATFACSSRLRRFSRRTLAFLNPKTPSSAYSHILSIIAIGIDTQHSVKEAVSALAQKHPDPRMRRRLHLAETYSSGPNPWLALSDNGIITKSQADALAHLDRSDAVTWCLREFARNQINQASYRKNFHTRLIHPIITSTFAVLVLIVAYAMISFLTEMIQALASVV